MKNGFTLIELLVVVAIIGILAAVGVVSYNGYTKSAKQNAAKSNHKVVVKFVTATMLKSTLNDGYFEGMYENNACQNTINKKSLVFIELICNNLKKHNDKKHSTRLARSFGSHISNDTKIQICKVVFTASLAWKISASLAYSQIFF